MKEMKNKRLTHEGGAMVAYMVRPNPAAAIDEHRRVLGLLKATSDSDVARMMKHREVYEELRFCRK